MNKTRWSITLLLAVVLILGSLPLVSAQDGGVAATVRQFAQVRVLPANSAASYARLEAGTEVTVVGRGIETNASGSTTPWLKLTTEDGTVGWTPARSLELPEGFDTETLPDAEPGADQGVVVRFANVRTVPGNEFDRTARLDQGTVVTVGASALGGDWLWGTAEDGTSGWVNKDALAFLGGAAPADLAEVADGTGVVLRFVNPRVAPNSDSDSEGRLDAGTLVEVLASANGGEYYLVGYTTGEGEEATTAQGWVLPRALAFIGSAPADVLETNGSINVAEANFRTGPGTEFTRLGWGYAGDRVQITGVSADGAWYRIVPLSRVGAFVSSALVDVDAGAGPFLVVSGPATEEAPAADAAASS